MLFVLIDIYNILYIYNIRYLKNIEHTIYTCLYIYRNEINIYIVIYGIGLYRL